MPSRDENGKRLHGSAQRKRRAAREAPDPPATKKPDPPTKKKADPAAPAPVPAAPDDDDGFGGANPFARLGEPPLEDTAQLVRWGAKIHALATFEIAKSPHWYPNRREWIRALTASTTQLGVIRDKAAEQQKIDDALRRDQLATKQQGLSSALGRKAAPVPRPGS